MTTLLLAVLLVPVSYLLHCALHEYAHVLAARIYGVRHEKVSLLPRRTEDGRFVFAYVTFEKEIPGEAVLPVYFAPVIAETIYFTVLSQIGPALKLPTVLLALGMLASTIDVGRWASAYFLPSPSPLCDAERVRSELGFSKIAGAICGAIVVGAMLLTTAFAVLG